MVPVRPASCGTMAMDLPTNHSIPFLSLHLFWNHQGIGVTGKNEIPPMCKEAKKTVKYAQIEN
jgi:hypothetical protein